MYRLKLYVGWNPGTNERLFILLPELYATHESADKARDKMIESGHGPDAVHVYQYIRGI